jgi:hypothetical protein
MLSCCVGQLLRAMVDVTIFCPNLAQILAWYVYWLKTYVQSAHPSLNTHAQLELRAESAIITGPKLVYSTGDAPPSGLYIRTAHVTLVLIITVRVWAQCEFGPS